MDPKTINDIKQFSDFGLSVQEIHDIYLPNIPLREIATTLELPVKEIEKIVKAGKKSQVEKPKTFVRPVVKKPTKPLPPLPPRKTQKVLVPEAEDPLAKYLAIEKPEVPVLLSQKKVDSVECPMISRQQILDRLSQVKANIDLGPSEGRLEEWGLAPRTQTNISLGPNSEKIAASLQKALTSSDEAVQKRVYLIFGRFSSEGEFVPGVTRDEFTRVQSYLNSAKYQWVNNPVIVSTVSKDKRYVKMVSPLGTMYRATETASIFDSPEYDYRIFSIDETPQPPEEYSTGTETVRETDVYLNPDGNIRISLLKTKKDYEIELEILSKAELSKVSVFKQLATFSALHSLATTLLSQAKDMPIYARPPPSASKIVDDIFQGLKTKPSPSTFVEVEASLGTFFGSSFVPGVTLAGFSRIGKFLAKEGYSVEASTEYSKVEIDGVIRAITIEGEDTIYQRKERSKTYDSPTYGYRISSSTETTISKPDNFAAKVVRNRKRSTFWNPERNAKVELTEVEEIIGENRPHKKFEVEIELLPQSEAKKGKVMTLDQLYQVCIALLTIAEGVNSQSQLMTRTEYSTVVSSTNNVLKVSGAKEGQMTRNYLSKPVNLKLADLLTQAHGTAVTNKLDGERSVLIITTVGVYAYTRDVLTKVGEIGPTPPEVTNNIFILDTEVTEDENGGKTFWPFDVLAAGKDTFAADVRKRSLAERDKLRQSVSEIQGAMTLWNGTFIDLSKTYYYPSNTTTLYQNIANAEKWEKDHPGLSFDGIIFQPLGAYFAEAKKWKPAEKMTIDFLLRSVGDGKFEYLVKNKRNFERPNYPGVTQTISLPKDFSKEYDGDRTLDLNEMVVECKFSKSQNSFVVYRLRPDRPNPNDISVAQSVFEDIVRPLSIETLRGQDLTVMRYAHNRTKEFLLQNFRGKKAILDVGSGQGGDLRKWAAIGLEKVFALEPSEEMRTEFKKRFAQLPDSQRVGITLKPFGVQETKKVLEAVEGQVQGVSAFFSLTFLGGSKQDVQDLGATVNGLLPLEEQRFVGIVMDGNEVHALLDLADGFYSSSIMIDGKSKVLYTITDSGEKSEITSGFTSRKIIVDIPDSNVRNVEEWTFPFAYFTRWMKEHSFRLVSSGYLSPSSKSEIKSLITEVNPTQDQVDKTYAKLPFESQVFSSLQKFFVFERGHSAIEALGGDISLPSRGKSVDFHQVIEGIDFVEERLQLHHVLQNNSAIFAAFLDVYDPSFYAPEPSEKMKKEISVLERKIKLFSKPGKHDKKVIEKTEKELEIAKERATKRTDGSETQMVNAFRKTLGKFIKEMDEDLIPFEVNSDDRASKKYGGQAMMAEKFADPKEEIPLTDAVNILSAYASTERSELLTIVVLGPKGLIYVSECYNADSVIMLYQTFSEVAIGKGAAIPADVRSTQHLYFPIVPSNSESRILDGHEGPGELLITKVCPP